MHAAGWALFDTAIGRCGIAWSARGILRLQLPERDDAATTARLTRGMEGAAASEAPGPVRMAQASIRRLLDGERTDLCDVALDLEAEPEFNRRVYAATRAIPPGETCSYGEIARALGEPGAARAVGHALGLNPVAILIPCHRVLAADGSLHGFSAAGGLLTKQRLLEIERAQAAGTLPLFP